MEFINADFGISFRDFGRPVGGLIVDPRAGWGWLCIDDNVFI
jgi:hypothetical protein